LVERDDGMIGHLRLHHEPRRRTRGGGSGETDGRRLEPGWRLR
jgi:hypothetical protein